MWLSKSHYSHLRSFEQTEPSFQVISVQSRHKASLAQRVASFVRFGVSFHQNIVKGLRGGFNSVAFHVLFGRTAWTSWLIRWGQEKDERPNAGPTANDQPAESPTDQPTSTEGPTDIDRRNDRLANRQRPRDRPISTEGPTEQLTRRSTDRPTD